MSVPQPPKPAKLVIGLLMKDKSLVRDVAVELEEAFGPLDIVSPWFPFDYTTYYEPEMGAPLFRRMLVFRTLIAQESLADIKQITNAIEQNYAHHGKRRVNIDPGYLLLERLVLATGKNFTHRIYIGQHIYADLTLIFQKGKFQTLPWTYPDYAAANMHTFLMQVRHKYMEDVKQASLTSLCDSTSVIRPKKETQT
jgi:hypothetical protein